MCKAGDPAQQILIPLQVADCPTITGYVILDDRGFPENGQSTLFDYTGDSFREGSSSLVIHRELGNRTLQDGYTLALLKLAHSIDHSNIYTSNHAVKTAYWARNIAARLGFSAEEQDLIETAGKLHDVGKVVVPKSVLTKPSHLSEPEWVIMKRHPTFGAMIMKPSPHLHALIPAVVSHHEKFDGSGYPHGLVGEQIPIQARIIAVADAYSTITEGRVFRPAGSQRKALQELIHYSGKQFDPRIVAVMLELATSGMVDDSRCTWEAMGALTQASGS